MWTRTGYRYRIKCGVSTMHLWSNTLLHPVVHWQCFIKCILLLLVSPECVEAFAGTPNQTWAFCANLRCSVYWVNPRRRNSPLANRCSAAAQQISLQGFLSKPLMQLLIYKRRRRKHLVLDAVVSWEICGVELKNHKLENSAVGPHCLYRYGPI